MEFRDGKREVPDYLADVIRRYEDRLYKITYVEAMELANRTMLSDVVSSKLDKAIAEHFRRYG